MSAVETAIRVVIDLLVRGEYGTVEAMDRGGRLSAEDLRAVIAEYGRRLVSPPADWWEAVTITEMNVGDGRAVHIAAPLWTAEEGRSDLTLELQLTEIVPEAYETVLLDLHVL